MMGIGDGEKWGGACLCAGGCGWCDDHNEMHLNNHPRKYFFNAMNIVIGGSDTNQQRLMGGVEKLSWVNCVRVVFEWEEILLL